MTLMKMQTENKRIRVIFVSWLILAIKVSLLGIYISFNKPCISLYSFIIDSDFPSVIAPDLHKLTQHLHKNEHKKRSYCLMAIASITLILNKHFWHIINNSFYFLSNRFSVTVQKSSSNTHHVICVNFDIHFSILFYKS